MLNQEHFLNDNINEEEIPSRKIEKMKTVHIVDKSDDSISKKDLIVSKNVSLKLQNCTSMFGKKFKNIKKKNIAWSISSLKETKIIKLINKGENMIEHHKKTFSRIYPGGKRVSSSNYDPIFSFNNGAQIVALNFQTFDKNMLINLGKFDENGGIYSGYW